MSFFVNIAAQICASLCKFLGLKNLFPVAAGKKYGQRGVVEIFLVIYFYIMICSITQQLVKKYFSRT